jgi:hypothetical protein
MLDVVADVVVGVGMAVLGSFDAVMAMPLGYESGLNLG